MSDGDLSAYREKVRAWLARASFPEEHAELAHTYAANRAWHRQLAEAGWLGVNWPREYGGQGLGTAHQLVVMEELARAGAPFPLAIINLYVVGPTLIAWGTPQQKDRHLRRILHAEEIWCQGFSEPGAGSDLASLRTCADAEGDGFVVNGQKIWTSQAQFADFCALLVRTDPQAGPHQGISYLIVDMQSPGIRVRPIRQLTGDAMFNEVFFDDVRVPAGNLIGALNSGWQVAMRSLASERSVIISQRKAEAEAMLRTVIGALRAAGGDVGEVLRCKLGRARMQLAALDAQVREMNERLQHERAAVGMESLDKLVLTPIEQDIMALAFDLLGPWRQVPQGAPPGLEAARIIRKFFYSRSYSISGGTTQIQRDIVARRLLELPTA